MAAMGLCFNVTHTIAINTGMVEYGIGIMESWSYGID